EDGIRDFHVTGVQTCALPISARGFHILNNLFKYNAACYGTHGAIEAARSLAREHGVEGRQIDRIQIRTDKAAERMCNIVGPRTRSEERRVGKAGGSRGAASQQ